MKVLFPLPAMLLAGVTTAQAHAMLEHADPGAGTTVPAPKAVILEYSEPLEAAFSDVAVTDAGGNDVAAGASSATGRTMQIRLKPLKPGTYRVQWHAVSIDTHRTAGSYTFTVAP